jgi:hypothetical protein
MCNICFLYALPGTQRILAIKIENLPNCSQKIFTSGSNFNPYMPFQLPEYARFVHLHLAAKCPHMFVSHELPGQVVTKMW